MSVTGNDKETVMDQNNKKAVFLDQLIDSLSVFLQRRIHRIMKGGARGRLQLSYDFLKGAHSAVAIFQVYLIPDIGEAPVIKIELARFCLASGKFFLFDAWDQMHRGGEHYIERLSQRLERILEDFGCESTDDMGDIYIVE